MKHSPAPGDPPTPGPFTYRFLEEPLPGETEEVDVVEVDGRPGKYEGGILILRFDAPDVEMELPEGKLAGIQAHHALIEPVLRDFNLDVAEQSRIPFELKPTIMRPDGSVETPPPITRWRVRPNFQVHVLGAEVEPLDNFQAIGESLGFRGEWVFHRRRTAGVFARSYRLNQRMHCYQLSFVGPNGFLSVD